MGRPQLLICNHVIIGVENKIETTKVLLVWRCEVIVKGKEEMKIETYNTSIITSCIMKCHIANIQRPMQAGDTCL